MEFPKSLGSCNCETNSTRIDTDHEPAYYFQNSV